MLTFIIYYIIYNFNKFILSYLGGKPIIKHACIAFIGNVEPTNSRTYIGLIFSDPG